jgi:ubiquinone/menaquinone biosynthesis C-methylase UbiE
MFSSRKATFVLATSRQLSWWRAVASTAACRLTPSPTNVSIGVGPAKVSPSASLQVWNMPTGATRLSSIAHHHHELNNDQRQDIQIPSSPSSFHLSHLPIIPDYLRQHYWWAYISPTMIRTLDRQFLVDIVLWGNFGRLRDAALHELQVSNNKSSGLIQGKTLQLSCVYANLTETLANHLAPDATLDVVDVVPAQLENLNRKLHRNDSLCHNEEALNQVTLSCRNATDLHGFADESMDQVLIFFLLHETPDDVRRQALSEACRVLKSNGGKLVLIDYHRPSSRLWEGIMSTMYRIYEPFAYDLWMRDLSSWFPESMQSKSFHKDTYFGGLYQKVVVTK